MALPKRFKSQPLGTLLCPKGHALPNVTKQGRCSPMHCAARKGIEDEVLPRGVVAATSRKAPRAPEAILATKATRELVKVVLATPTKLPDGASQALADDGRMEGLAHASIGEGKLQARHAFIKDLPSADADEVTINNWTDARFLKLLPVAVAEVEYQLKYGDDEQREKAANKILSATGRATKEGHLSGGASIILNLGGLTLPYAPRASANTETDAEVVEVDVAKKQA